MKYLLVIFTLTTFFRYTQATEKTAISYDPQDIAVQLINDAAADAWAEDANTESLEYKKLKCNLETGKCILNYTIKMYNEAPQEKQCVLTGIHGYDKLISVVKYGIVLDDKVYDQVDACMK